MEFFDFSITEIFVRLALGLGIGFCIGLTGVGGGVLVLPALTVILRIDPIIAVGTTTLYAFLTKITATLQHIRLKTIDWGTSLRFLTGAIPANIITALWVSRQAENEAFRASLKTFIVGMILFSVVLMMLNMLTRIRPAVVQKERSLADHINGSPIMRNTVAASMGFICGSLVGATSIGGGVLIVPILIIFFGLPTSRTVGSSIFIAFILTLSTSIIYATNHAQDRATAIIMALGSLSGVYYGSKLSVKLPETMLRAAVLAMVLIAALMMFGGL